MILLNPQTGEISGRINFNSYTIELAPTLFWAGQPAPASVPSITSLEYFGIQEISINQEDW
jgi:hypothetical protein